MPDWEKLREEMGDNIVVEVSLDEIRRDTEAMRADAALTAAFDETKHPRYVKGTKTAGKVKGGRFSPKGATAPQDGEDEEKQKPEHEGAVVTTIVNQDSYRRTIAKMREPQPAAFEWPPPLPETAEKLDFGDATDSRQLAHVTDGAGNYTPERLALHSEIVGRFLDRSGMVKQQNPEVLFMAGGSGSGKTSVLGKQRKDGSGVFDGSRLDRVPENAVYVNPDDIKEMLPEYQAMIDLNDPGAASFVHEESSTIAKKLLDTAYERGYNIVLDGTGDSTVGKFYEKVKRAEDLGYSTRVVMVDIPTEQAVQRAKERAAESGRMVPVSEIRLVHRNVSANFNQWQDQVGDWELWDNSGENDPKIVAKRKPSS